MVVRGRFEEDSKRKRKSKSGLIKFYFFYFPVLTSLLGRLKVRFADQLIVFHQVELIACGSGRSGSKKW